MSEVPKFRTPDRPDGHDSVLDRLLSESLPTELSLGKHAVGGTFDLFLAWVDSGDSSFPRYITGLPDPEEQDAEIYQLPVRDAPEQRAIAGN